MEEIALKYCDARETSPFESSAETPQTFAFGRKRKPSPTAKIVTDEEQAAIDAFYARQKTPG